MGNGIAVILLHTDQTKFDKRSSIRGISKTAYLGRLIHTLSNMIDIVIIEEDSDEESVFGEVGESADSDSVKSDNFGAQDSEYESNDCQVAERCEDVKNGINGQGLGESADATEYGDFSNKDGVQDMHSEFESSDCQMAEDCCSQDEMDTNKDEIGASTMDENDDNNIMIS